MASMSLAGWGEFSLFVDVGVFAFAFATFDSTSALAGVSDVGVVCFPVVMFAVVLTEFLVAGVVAVVVRLPLPIFESEISSFEFEPEDDDDDDDDGDDDGQTLLTF